MKLRTAPLFLLPLLVLFAAAASSVQDRKAEFMAKYKQAQTIGAKQELVNLVKKYEDEAVLWILETAEHISNAPNDEVFERIASLRDTWQDAMKTDFVDKMEKYYSLLDAPTKRQRKKARTEYDDLWRKYLVNIKENDQTTFTVLGQGFERLAELFEGLGDKYFASQCWSFSANCYDEFYRTKNADLYKACAAFGNFVRLREEIGLPDKLYRLTKPRFAALLGQGYGPREVDPVTGEEIEPVAAAANTPATMVPLAFELIDDVQTFDRPSYYLDEIYAMWHPLALQGKGTTVSLPRIENGPLVMRTGSSEVYVDVDADGEGDQKIPLTGKLTPVSFKLGQGEEEREWGFLTILGIEKDNYNNIETNLAPTDEYMTLYTIAAGSLVGDLAGTSIRVIDEDMDGIYGSLPRTWGFQGLSEGRFQPDIDSVIIGDGKRAQPWSEYVEVGGQWYKMASQKGGKEIAATPVDVETGTLKLKFKGGKPAWLIVKGEGTYENAYFDLAAGKVDVPKGRWSLFYGELRTGKKRQMIKTVILPGDNTPKWAVEPGGEAEVELGAPFDFDFQFVADEETITVEGKSVVVIGSAFERYERPWGCVPRPEVSYRKAGAKKGSKGKKMPAVQSQDDLTTYGWGAAWAPLDLVLAKKASEEEVEVQLFEKKNKLFGKISSTWRK